MNLYLISQPGKVGYDEYDSAVVCAENETEARKIHPGGLGYEEVLPDASAVSFGTWCRYEEVEVLLIGAAVPLIAKGVVLGSFNAG